MRLFEVLPTFREAAHQARDIARFCDQTTVVARNAKGWAVLVQQIPDRGLLAAARLDETGVFRDDTDYGYYALPEDVNEGYTSEEFSSDQDDWQRSDEDGWFYPD